MHHEEIKSESGGLKRKGRDRMRSVRKRVVSIALSARLLGPRGEERRKRQYRELLSLTRKVMNQAQRVLEEAKQAPRRRRTPWEGLAESLETMAGRVGQVVEQARLRIFAGDTTAAGRIVSAFRTAHRNDSQRESEQAHRVWQASQDSGSGKPNRDPL